MKIDDLKKKQSQEQESSQIEFLRSEKARVEAELKSYRQVEGFQKELLDTVKNATAALEPLPPVKYKTSHAATDTEMAAVIKFSDWHIGEVVLPTETEGFGVFNWQIAQERVKYITLKFLGAIEAQRRIFKIPKLYVFAEGDFVSGDIHDELRRTNEFPLPVQAVNAGALLAQAVSTVAPHFSEVRLIEVGSDNHSRLQPRPQFKQKGKNSMSFVVHAMANALLRNHKNVQPEEAEGIKKLVSVNGINVLTEHGDTVKAWMGIPFYGLERARGREAVRRMQAMLEKARQEFTQYQNEIGFDYISTAHWHVPGVVSGNILINGSLNGTTEFDHGCGRHARPAQVSYLMHPKYKMFNWTPWTVKN